MTAFVHFILHNFLTNYRLCWEWSVCLHSQFTTCHAKWDSIKNYDLV